jgi:hypothetical protein
MFETVSMSFDFKDLSNLKSALENQIEYLQMSSFADEEFENIQEHQDLLNRINKKFEFVLGNDDE